MEGSEAESERRLNQDDTLPHADCDSVADIAGDERRGYSYAAAVRRIRAHVASSGA